MNIGIVSPSAPIAAFCPRRFSRGVAALEASGHTVIVGAHAQTQTGFTAGSVVDRVADIHAFFEDPAIDLVMCTIGGYNANDLLDQLDYTAIAQHPKPFIGYSDMTVLIHTLQTRAGVPTYFGPMLLPQFGEYPEPLAFTRTSFERVLKGRGTGEVYDVPVADAWTEEFLAWDSADDRPRQMQPHTGWSILRPGTGEGRLSGGNLRTLLALAGTRYQPDTADTILFLEDDAEESPATVQRMLRQAEYIGMLSKIRGLVFGRFQTASGMDDTTLQTILHDVLGQRDIPVVAGVDFGHTDPQLTLPLCASVALSTESVPSIRITL